MPRTKPTSRPASKRSRRKKEVAPVVGVVSLSLASGVAVAGTPGTVVDSTGPKIPWGPQLTLSEEEISDVSLGRFFVFDKENVGETRAGQQHARGCGCRGCGCRGCRSCRVHFRGCGGCGGCGCGGCGCCWTWGYCRIC